MNLLLIHLFFKTKILAKHLKFFGDGNFWQTFPDELTLEAFILSDKYCLSMFRKTSIFELFEISKHFLDKFLNPQTIKDVPMNSNRCLL